MDRLTYTRELNEAARLLKEGNAELAEAILERLLEVGCLERRVDGDTRLYRSRNEPWQPMLAELRILGLKIDPANAATLDLLDYAAALYPSVARGEQSGDHSQETGSINQETPGWSYGGQQQPSHCRTDDPGAVEEHRVQRDGVDDEE